MTEPASTRTRDPARKEKILAAAAELIARDGYHVVSLADIGREAGIVGSGVYRHFDSKVAILVALFDGVIDDLLTDVDEAGWRTLTPADGWTVSRTGVPYRVLTLIRP